MHVYICIQDMHAYMRMYICMWVRIYVCMHLYLYVSIVAVAAPVAIKRLASQLSVAIKRLAAPQLSLSVSSFAERYTVRVWVMSHTHAYQKYTKVCPY